MRTSSFVAINGTCRTHVHADNFPDRRKGHHRRIATCPLQPLGSDTDITSALPRSSLLTLHRLCVVRFSLMHGLQSRRVVSLIPFRAGIDRCFRLTLSHYLNAVNRQPQILHRRPVQRPMQALDRHVRNTPPACLYRVPLIVGAQGTPIGSLAPCARSRSLRQPAIVRSSACTSRHNSQIRADRKHVSYNEHSNHSAPDVNREDLSSAIKSHNAEFTQ